LEYRELSLSEAKDIEKSLEKDEIQFFKAYFDDGMNSKRQCNIM
jgi:hypothetical protein